MGLYPVYELWRALKNGGWFLKLEHIHKSLEFGGFVAVYTVAVVNIESWSSLKLIHTIDILLQSCSDK